MLCAKPPFFPGFGLSDLGRRARKDPERNPPEHAWEWEPGGRVSPCEDRESGGAGLCYDAALAWSRPLTRCQGDQVTPGFQRLRLG